MYDEHGICRCSNDVIPRAILAPAGGVLVAIAGWIVPGLKLLFDGAWLSATLVSFVTYALTRPATAAGARLTPALSENG